MPSSSGSRFATFSAILAVAIGAILFVGCSSDEGAGPNLSPPTITVSGVTDGQVLDEPVTISVTVDAGASYVATLNGSPFFSPSTVSEPGSYTLKVDATRSGVTASRTIDFEIRFSGESILIVRMFDLGDNGAGGGGDAMLLSDSSAAGQRHALIDAGPEGLDASNEGFVQARLAALGVDALEVMVLTHAHSDHYGGMDPVLLGTTVETFAYNGQTRSLSGYNTVVSRAQARADAVVVPTETTTWTIGLAGTPTSLQVIPGLPTNLNVDTDDGSDINDGSLGTTVTKGAFRMFVAGDGETDANARWRTSFSTLTGGVTALKVGHHGANDAIFDDGFQGSGTTWLEHTGADVHLISANGTSHPRVAALNAILGRAGRTYCTNVHGDIELRASASGQWTVTVERSPDMDCEPGTLATS